MAEANIKVKAGKPGATPVAGGFESGRVEAKVGTPSFENALKFDMPRIEIPAAFRDIAEKSLSQAKDAYERVKAVAEETTDLLEETCSTATKGAVDYTRKVIEHARVNTNANFDFARDLMGVTSFASLLELSTAHARKQYETLSEQSKELLAIAQKVATETAEPVKAGVSKAFSRAA